MYSKNVQIKNMFIFKNRSNFGKNGSKFLKCTFLKVFKILTYFFSENFNFLKNEKVFDYRKFEY
jgi:hypothetical protein